MWLSLALRLVVIPHFELAPLENTRQLYVPITWLPPDHIKIIVLFVYLVHKLALKLANVFERVGAVRTDQVVSCFTAELVLVLLRLTFKCI